MLSVGLGQSASVAREKKRCRTEAAADLFIKKFHETLDFGVAFDQLAVSDAIQRLRRTDDIKGLGLTEELDKSIDDETAARFYKDSMNFIHLMNVYGASLKVGSSDPDIASLPEDMLKVINSSKQLKHIFSDSVEDFPNVANLNELRRYMTDLNRMSALYRKHLRRNVFTSQTYRKNIETLEKERGQRFQVSKGDDHFSVDEKTEVYSLCRDIFCFEFVEEHGRLKVLGLVFD